MDLSKTDTEKNDSKSTTKIPPTAKASSHIKVSTLRSSGSVETSKSKIPKRDSFNLSPPKENNVPSYKTKTTKLKKAEDTKKTSISMMNLRMPKTCSLASSGSNIYSHRSAKSRDQTPRFGITDKTFGTHNKVERAAVKRNLQSFEAAKDKLKACQETFMSKYDVVKDELPSEEGEFRFVSLVKNNEGQLLAKTRTTKIKTMCDKKTLEELKTFLRNFTETKLNSFFNLDMLSNSPREIGDTFLKDQNFFKQFEEAKKKLIADKKAFLDDFSKQIENFQACDKSKDPTSNKDLETKIQSYLDEVNELKNALQASKTEYATCKNKLTAIKKELEEKTKNHAKKQLELEELKSKYESLEKENSNRKTINAEVSEKLKKKTFECEELNKKLKKCAETNVNLEAKNKLLEAEMKKVEIELSAALKERDAGLLTKDSVGDQARTHADELRILKNEIIMKAKIDSENYENEVKHLKDKIIHLEQMNSKCMQIQDEVQKKTLENQTLNQTIRDLEDKLQVCQNQACMSGKFQEKLTKLQDQDSLNKEKIQKLEKDLTKAQFNIKELEDKIAMDRKLLKVRSCLIDSLQKKEQSQKVRLEDLFAEVGEKNNDLQMIKTEILTKTEEFQNLFSTLGTKQLELTRQEHMIKLLQESNERAQKLRVRQEAKIARLEEEIIELKQAISIYQDVVLPNNVLRRNLAIAETSRDSDCTDSLGFYVEERRRKRHIDINVKKYEK